LNLAYGLLVRKGGAHGCRQGIGRNCIIGDAAVTVVFGADNPIDREAFLRPAVEAGFVEEDEANEEAGDYTDVEAEKIEGKKAFLFTDAAPGSF
jgi:hypothetical protein